MDTKVLESQDHRNLLDIIDRLRSKGISQYVDLPEIIVCGDQSAGKSSVLEAISGVSFPTKDNLCTRFATELVLRRDAKSGVKVSILPGPDRTKDEAERLSCVDFETTSDKPDLGDLIEKAKDAMGITDNKVFSADSLRVEICGSTQPHLTLVDLPGLFRAGNSEQSKSDSKIVKRMVRGYMKRPRSIILAVVSAKSDFALQEVTEFAREIDHRGVRTMGLITKPDTLDAGSDSENSYIRLAQNKDVIFRLGWHVLKNRSYETRSASSVERDQDEEAFFSTGVWAGVDPACLGVATLKPRLSSVLRDQILQQLPSLLDDVRAGILDCRMRLERIGAPRTNTEERRRFLLRVSQDFTALMRSAVDGVYNDHFFGSARTDEGFDRRLRAVVQDALDRLQDNMCSRGHTRLIVDSPPETSALKPDEISRSDYLDEVIELMRRTKGCELFGTFNPLIIGELFAAQCQPWEKIATEAKDSIVQAVVRTTRAILGHITVDETAEELYRMIGQRVDILKKSTDDKLAELLKPHLEGHPITYNHYLIENVQKARLEREQEKLDNLLKSLGIPISDGLVDGFDVEALRRSYARRTEDNMKTYTSELAVDYVKAYYKVALKRFVDDVSVLAVEQCLMQKTTSLLDVTAIYELSDHEVTQIAAESPKLTAERSRCAEKEATLESGLQELERLSRHALGIIDLYEYDEDYRSEGTPGSTASSSPHANSRDDASLPVPIVPDQGDHLVQQEESATEDHAPSFVDVGFFGKSRKKVKRANRW